MARVANDRRSSILPESAGVHGEKRIAAASFLATCLSVFVVYFIGWQPAGEGLTVAAAARSLWFTASLMAILMAHEMGHWLAARWCGFRISLPLFIPFPFLVGTLGAIIRMEQPPKDRSSLLRMGAAGPLAGLVMVIILMSVRLFHGVGVGELTVDSGGISLGSPMLWTILASLQGDEIGQISPFDPVAFGAWIGCLVTAMNLLPFGQLDGGHIVRGLLSSRRTRGLNVFVTIALMIAGFWWFGWIVWVSILWIIRADKGLDQFESDKVSRVDQVLGVFCLGCFLLCVTLIPFQFAP